MFQELLISDTALKMAGAFAISLETNIDRKDIETAVKDFQVWRLIRVVMCISIIHQWPSEESRYRFDSLSGQITDLRHSVLRLSADLLPGPLIFRIVSRAREQRLLDKSFQI